ncbi:MAG: protein translocase subunit SecF [Parcubacteria group bacterium]|jgi:preprotein translocase subunit SecF
MIDFIEKRKYFYAFSGTLAFLSVLAIALWGLKLGIDFVGGTEMEFKIGDDVSITKDVLCAKIEGGCASDFTVLESQSEHGRSIFVRYKSSDEVFNQKVLAAVKEIDSTTVQLKSDFIGAMVSTQLKSNAAKAILFSIIAILLYIAWAFRKISVPVSSWYYGISAVVALAHDILITIGVFAFLGHFYDHEIGVPFIAALLTILGYSINDTIVVYDRVRENMLKTRAVSNFHDMVNKSLNETLARSINTSMTVIIVLIPMVLFGGESLFNFSLALLIGVAFGTYSSIFVATALVVTIYHMQQKYREQQARA